MKTKKQKQFTHTYSEYKNYFSKKKKTTSAVRHKYKNTKLHINKKCVPSNKTRC